MKNVSGDASCAKLLLKKSSGHLKISLAMFLASILITSIIGLLYAKQYFQYEKDYFENVAIRTVYVNANFNNNRVRSMNPADIDEITQIIKNEYPNKEITVIPVYTTGAGLSINGSPVNLYAIDQSHCFFANLDHMDDNTAYFTNQQPDTIAIEISVMTEMPDGGFESSEMKRVLLHTAAGVSKRTPVLRTQDILPGTLNNATAFVSMNTFRDIVSVLLGREAEHVNEAIGDNGIVRLKGIFVYVDDLRLVSPVSSFLTEQNYRAHAPLDAFDDFGETLSVTFLVFLLSSIVLLCMTTINILLSFRSFYRVQQKDIGILVYMGFDNKRIFKMYYKNLGKKFMQIMVLSSLFVFLLGMILFSFEHWLVLLVFILSLCVFLFALFFVICRFILYRYVGQDLLVLIRESKEFE